MYNIPNRQKDILFDTLIGGMDKTAQATLRHMYTISRNHDEFIHRQEMEQMKKEIAEYVISHISATVDISDVITQIEELRRAIDSLDK